MAKQFAASFAALLVFCWSASGISRANSDNEIELAPLSPMMAGMLGANFCDFEIDRNVAGSYLSGKFPAANFNANQLAFAIWAAYAQQSMQASLGILPANKKQRASYCNSILKAFGPNGTDIPSLVHQ
ncbi:MAG: hypothetical protein KGO53_15635 [Alphaproteobacteria bacterium]|nr:hypothetical protein [Alphaproteobacteria bacterium]